MTEGAGEVALADQALLRNHVCPEDSFRLPKWPTTQGKNNMIRADQVSKFLSEKKLDQRTSCISMNVDLSLSRRPDASGIRRRNAYGS
jgi:hypothetical protein